MPKLRVINKGDRTRSRLGVRFVPNKEVEIEVSNKEYLTVKAVRDFDVEIIKEEEKEQKQAPEKNNQKEANEPDDTKGKGTGENTGANTPDGDNDEKTDEQKEAEVLEQLKTANVDDFLKLVEDNNIDIDKAIAIETANKNRVTLIDELEQLKDEKGE